MLSMCQITHLLPAWAKSKLIDRYSSEDLQNMFAEICLYEGIVIVKYVHIICIVFVLFLIIVALFSAFL